MAARREGLRPLLPKPPKKVAKTNAEKCRDCQERIRQDQVKQEERLTRSREIAKRYRDQSKLNPTADQQD